MYEEEISDKVSQTLLKTIKLIEKYYEERGNIILNHIRLKQMYYNARLEIVDNYILDLLEFKARISNIKYKLDINPNNIRLLQDIDYCEKKINFYENEQSLNDSA